MIIHLCLLSEMPREVDLHLLTQGHRPLGHPQGHHPPAAPNTTIREWKVSLVPVEVKGYYIEWRPKIVMVTIGKCHPVINGDIIRYNTHDSIPTMQPIMAAV